MARLKFVGPITTADTGLVTKGSLSALLSGNITQTQMNNLITSGLSAYATTTYVDQQDFLLATSQFIDDEDAKRLSKENLNTPGYPFTLDANGKVPATITGITTTRQRYPRSSVAAGGGSASTTSSATVGSLIPVAAPGYDYKLLVTGSVHASISADGVIPSVTVTRSDGAVVATGVGIGENYTTPAVNSQSSQMYLKANYTLTANNTWTTVPGFAAVNTTTYVTTLSGNGIQATKTMTGATITANLAFAGAAAPLLGATISQIRIFCPTTNTVIATSPAITGASGVCTVSTTTNITAGHVYVVQALTNNGINLPFGVYDPLFNPGVLATWSGGATNVLTITAPNAANTPSGEIPLIPSLIGQTALSGSSSTTLSVRLQSASGATASTATYYSPYIWVVPIPA